MRLIDADLLERELGIEDWDIWVSHLLEEAPTVEERKKGKWIPCSERLPEENGRYLVTNSAWGAMEVDWNAWVNGAWLYPNTKPIAWMPLPEPYQSNIEEKADE